MIRVGLTDAAYDAIASTLPKGAARWPVQRDQGHNASSKSRRLWSINGCAWNAVSAFANC
jgi:hypothetical protein